MLTAACRFRLRRFFLPRPRAESSHPPILRWRLFPLVSIWLPYRVAACGEHTALCKNPQKKPMKAKATIKTTTKTSVKAKDIQSKKSPKGGKMYI